MPMEPVWLQCDHCAQPHQHESGAALTAAAQAKEDRRAKPDIAQRTPISEQGASATRTRWPTVCSVSSGRQRLGWTLSLIIDWTLRYLWRRQPTG